MNENLKKRILGVIIIIIISIIILPMLFKGTGKPELKYSNIDSQNDIKFKYIDEVKKLKKEMRHKARIIFRLKKKKKFLMPKILKKTQVKKTG
mgnify:CR=1 FL=1